MCRTIGLCILRVEGWLTHKVHFTTRLRHRDYGHFDEQLDRWIADCKSNMISNQFNFVEFLDHYTFFKKHYWHTVLY